MSDPSDSETVERLIPAPADKIFALLSDPTRHPEFDGSGAVRNAKKVPDHLELGASFGMSMKVGIPYSMVSTVIEFEPDRRIAWQTYPPGLGRRLAGGRIWRYELEPTDGGTLVRETWDISQERVKAMVRGARKSTITAMGKSLERIEEIVTASDA